jgi:hypothetical protein
MIDINVRGGKLGHGTEDKAAANEGDLDLHWVLAGTEAAKRSGLFIGHNNIVSVSVGALVAAAEEWAEHSVAWPTPRQTRSGG